MPDWIATIRAQGDIAKRMSEEIPKALGNPDITSQQLNQLYKLVVRCGNDLDAIVDKMGEYEVDEALYEAAEALESIWDRLTIAVGMKIREKRGRPPIHITL